MPNPAQNMSIFMKSQCFQIILTPVYKNRRTNRMSERFSVKNLISMKAEIEQEPMVRIE